MAYNREERVRKIVDVLTKIVQRAHRPEVKGSTHHKTCAVPAGLLEEAASILGINRDFT
jgi:hypothetical protein